MSLLLQQIFHEIDRLSLQEQMEVLTYAANRVKLQISEANPQERVTKLLDITPSLLGGKDEASSVDRSSDESSIPLLDFRQAAGLGRELWQSVDVELYIQQERELWD